MAEYEKLSTEIKRREYYNLSTNCQYTAEIIPDNETVESIIIKHRIAYAKQPETVTTDAELYDSKKARLIYPELK